MRILVTGGSGFIGSYTVQKLVSEGHTVKIFDRVEPKNPDALPKKGWQLVLGDLRTFANCLTACRDVDAVIHNAAEASISRTITHPLESGQINVAGMLNILQASAQSSIKRFVFMSSAKIYGDVEKYPASEDDLPRPATPYALTKLTGEFYCKYFSERHGLETVCLRPFSVFGPHQNMKIGYIGNIIESMCRDEAPRLPGPPDLARDFTYVEDVAEASLLAVTAQNTGSGIFNIGTGKAYSLFEVMTLANRITGKNITPAYETLVPGTAVMTLADITAAQKTLGYTPKIGFEEGFKRTFEWVLSKKKKDSE